MFTTFPGGGGGKLETCGFVTASTGGTILTANATPGTNGAYTQLIAATSFQYSGVWVCIQPNTFATADDALIDFAIGAAAGEQVVIPNMPWQTLASSDRSAFHYAYIPLVIPKGVRISARVRRSTVASMTCRVTLIGQGMPARGFVGFHRITDYGAVLASGRGTVVDPGGTANTLGTLTQLTASTTNKIDAMMVWCTRSGNAAQAGSFHNSLQVYKASTVLIPEYPTWIINSNTDVAIGSVVGPFFGMDIPAGTQLQAAARSTGITVGERESQVLVWGFD